MNLLFAAYLRDTLTVSLWSAAVRLPLFSGEVRRLPDRR